MDITRWAKEEHHRLCTCELQMEIKCCRGDHLQLILDQIMLVLASMSLRLREIKKVPRTKIYAVDKLKESDIRKDYREALWKNIMALVKEEMNVERAWNSVKYGITSS